MSSDKDEEAKLDRVINALREEDAAASTSESEAPAETVKITVNPATKKKRTPKKKVGGPPAGPPPADATHRAVGGPPSGPPPANAAKRKRKSHVGPPPGAPPPEPILASKPSAKSYENTNKLYYSKFDEEPTDFLADVFRWADHRYAQLALKGLFAAAVTSGVGFGVALFVKGVKNWHVPCDMAIDISLLLMGSMMVAGAGLSVMVVTSKGPVRRGLALSSSLLALSYFVVLCMATALVTGGFSDQYNFTCNAYNTLDITTELVEGSWVFLSIITMLNIARFVGKRAKRQAEDSAYSRLKLSDVH